MTTQALSGSSIVEPKNPVKELKKATSGKFEPQLVIYANEPDTVEIGGEKKVDKKTVAKGAAILATVAAVVYLVKSGKGKQIFDAASLKFKQMTGKPLSMAEMKANFKTSSIMDGGYLKSNPEYYTGEVLAKAKNGNQTLLTYEGGAIKKAITKNPAGEVALEKTYGPRMTIESLGTDYVPITTKKADGTITKAAIGNYELAYAAGYPKFSIDSAGKVNIQPGYEDLLTEGTQLNKAINIIKDCL